MESRDTWWRRYASTHEPKKILRERPEPGMPPETGDPYLYRWQLWSIGLVSCYLHRIVRADNIPDYHDHPWPFWHMVLDGGYYEEYPSPYLEVNLPDRPRVGVLRKLMVPGRMAFHGTGYAHRIASILTPGGDAWTLVVVGPKRHEWGFVDRVTGCWTQWRAYIDGERC